MITWIKNQKRSVLISILVLILLIALWIFWPGKQENLTEAEQAALNFYVAINKGDHKTASEMDLEGENWEGYVRKSSEISSVKIMTPARENEVYILEPDGSGYILTMVKKPNGWKMATLKTERDLNVFVNQVYPEHEWKEVSLQP